MPHAQPWLVIGNPENRRVALFQAALAEAGLPPAQVIAYQQILEGRVDLAAQLTPGRVVRIESPGENFTVEQHLLALGGVAHAHQLSEERGRIHHPGAWFAGFRRLMAQLQDSAREVTWFTPPAQIVAMFDKPLCKTRFAPYTLPPCPHFAAFEPFLAYVRQQARTRFFVKLNYSSSASGILAYAYHRTRDEHLAYSTVEVVPGPHGPRFYNSLKIRRYSDLASIRAILDFLFAEGALVEPWVPKASHGSHSYDLRVLAIAGARAHSIARLSRSPMTNLHLGNQRCATAALGLADSVWAGIDALVGHTMARLPGALYAGLDVMLARDSLTPILLEANAFGDLLPNLLHHGHSTYRAEIEALRAKLASRPLAPTA